MKEKKWVVVLIVCAAVFGLVFNVGIGYFVYKAVMCFVGG